MKPIKIFFDKAGNTLNVWFDDPTKDVVSEETSEEIVIVKDKKGKVIGFEVLNYLSQHDLKGLKMCFPRHYFCDTPYEPGSCDSCFTASVFSYFKYH